MHGKRVTHEAMYALQVSGMEHQALVRPHLHQGPLHPHCSPLLLPAHCARGAAVTHGPAGSASAPPGYNTCIRPCRHRGVPCCLISQAGVRRIPLARACVCSSAWASSHTLKHSALQMSKTSFVIRDSETELCTYACTYEDTHLTSAMPMYFVTSRDSTSGRVPALQSAACSSRA